MFLMYVHVIAGAHKGRIVGSFGVTYRQCEIPDRCWGEKSE